MWRGLFAGLTALAFGAAPVAASPTALSPDAMVLAAGEALVAHQPDAALALADALLGRDGQDITALLLRARALRDMGRFDAALTAGQAAWAIAKSDAERHVSALVIAQIHASSGARTIAQLWLRRAAQYAETDRQSAVATRDFAYVRARNPWRFRLDLGAMPSSNVNGGSNKDSLTLFGLPFAISPDAQALSGFQATAAGEIAYRFHEGAKSESWIRLGGTNRQTWLSAASREAAPDAASGDYDYASLSLSLEHRLRFGENRKLSLRADIGRNWYGHAALSDYASLRMGVDLPQAGGRKLQLSARADLSADAGAPGAASVLGEIKASYTLPVFGQDRLRLSGTLRQLVSDDAPDEYRRAGVALDYRFGQPVLGTELSLGFGYGYADYPVSPYAPGGRVDRSLSARLTVSLPELSYYGFSPVISLEAERTMSNVALYSSDSLALGFSFRSDF